MARCGISDEYFTHTISRKSGTWCTAVGMLNPIIHPREEKQEYREGEGGEEPTHICDDG